MLLLILAAIWAAVLLPPWLQNRRERRPNDSIVSFRSQMGTLQRSAPSGGSLLNTQMSRREAQRRRRDILATLACAASLTLVLAIMLGGPVIALHLFVDVLLVAYVALLINAQQTATLRTQRPTANVHQLPTRRAPEHRPAMVLRRTGS